VEHPEYGEDVSDARVYYALTPGTEITLLENGVVVFRSPVQSLQLEGESAHFFANRVVPLLDGRTHVERICEQLAVAPEGLSSHLDMLAQAGVLVRSEYPSSEMGGDDIARPFRELLQSLEIPHEKVVRHLSELRILILGMGSIGAQVADLLARVGIGQLILSDPFECRQADLLVMPMLSEHALGDNRARVVAHALSQRGLIKGQRVTADTERYSEAHLRELSEGADLLICLPDNRLGRVRHWVNRIALQTGIPALFGSLQGYRAFAGPLVIPDETGCYMCWRMRHMACAEDFAASMAFEESCNESNPQVLPEEPSLPHLASLLASVLSAEVLKTLLAIGSSGLAGKVIEIHAWDLDLKRHTVLRRPSCPVCDEKKKDFPKRPALEQLNPQRDEMTALSLDQLADRLISPVCGVIKGFQRIAKDQSEPERPYIYRAELSNARFLEKGDREDRFIVCSGKGVNEDQARWSALGEAAERYSALLWNDEQVVRASFENLDQEALDPELLVLYRTEQYEGLPYDPFDPGTPIGWVPTRSLGTGQEILVPALGVLMAYDLRPEERYLFPITSNGLAAGPSLGDAILSGAFEVIERDAFLNLWLHRLPARPADPSTHPQLEIRRLWEAYRRRGVRIELYRIPMDHEVHVFIAIGFGRDSADEPAAVVGLGAGYHAARAAAGAILEVAQVRPALKIRMRDPEVRKRIATLVAEPHRVESLSDHDLLYCDRSQLGCFDFMRMSQAAPFEWPDEDPLTVTEQLTKMLTCLRQQDTDLLYSNLTTPDMAAHKLYCARAIIPGYQPIHFGRRERRLAADRLYRIPQRLGLTESPVGSETLNDAPHPLA
jgi:ribosomal protein S12 methylthiotransferase accessory factor